MPPPPPPAPQVLDLSSLPTCWPHTSLGARRFSNDHMYCKSCNAAGRRLLQRRQGSGGPALTCRRPLRCNGAEPVEPRTLTRSVDASGRKVLWPRMGVKNGMLAQPID